MTPPPEHTQAQAGLDRRPLASRRWRSMHRLAGAVAAAGITPNAISIAGMCSGIAAGVAMAGTAWTEAWVQRLLWIGAAACVQLRLVCNLIDGMVAVEGGKRSATGEIYNEVPDRVSDAATLIGAGYAAGSSPLFGYLAACLAIFVAYVRAVGKGWGMESDYSGPMAKQQRMLVVTLAALVCGALPESWSVALARALGDPSAGVMALALGIIILGCVLTSVRRLAHLAAFLRRRGVR